MSEAGRSYHHRNLLSGPEHAYATRPHGAVVVSSNPEKDTLTYTGPHGGRPTPISHPYLGPNSWIRIMPEARTGMIINSRADSGETFTQAYVTERTADTMISATYTEDPQFYYRRLLESEIDITSKGLASAHFGKSGTLSLRGGPVTQTLDADNLEIDASSPTFVYRTVGNEFGFPSNEIRFGVVKRLLSESDISPSWVQVPDQSGTPILAKEYMRHIGSESSTVPLLVDHREGNVVEDDGSETTSPVTGKKLRSRTIYGTSQSQESSLEVDEEGNMALNIPSNSSHGLDLNIERADLRLSVGKDEIHNVERNTLVESGRNIELEAPKIKLGRNATEDLPVIRGGDFETWVVSAVVQTAMGPANFSIPTQEAIKDTFSTKVFVE